MTEKEAQHNFGNYIKDAAFPQTVETEEKIFHTKGLTKREYFAAMALQGYISSGKLPTVSIVTVAELSVEQADALIEALNESKP